MTRKPLPVRRKTARRRPAPRWTAPEWEAATQGLLRRANGVCEICGVYGSGGFERHHRVRRRDGGDRPSNLIIAHATCHKQVTEHPAEARRDGHIVRFATDPVGVPARFHDGWFLLDDEFGRTRVKVPDGDAEVWEPQALRGAGVLGVPCVPGEGNHSETGHAAPV